MACLGLAVDRDTVLTPQCCLKSAQAGTTKKKKAFPGKLMLNVHRKNLKHLKVRRVLQNWNPVFQLSLHFQLSCIYMYQLTEQINNNNLVLKFLRYNQKKLCFILRSTTRIALHPFQRSKSLEQKLFQHSLTQFYQPLPPKWVDLFYSESAHPTHPKHKTLLTVLNLTKHLQGFKHKQQKQSCTLWVL